MGILSKILRSGIVGKTAGLSGDNDFWYGLTGGPTRPVCQSMKQCIKIFDRFWLRIFNIRRYRQAPA